MTDETTVGDAERASEPPVERFGVASIVAVVVLGLIAAWFVYDGVGSLLGLPALFAELGLEAETPWAALWLGALQAPVIFAAAAIGARRLPVGRYTIVLIAALGTIAALRLTLIAVATGTIAVFGA